MSASYPGAVKTFASRSNGQTIDASHVNDLQDEVNAIEAGLLNGTAPLNSSNSTVANLSVTGASTFAGNVVFTGTVTGGPFSPPRVILTHNSTQTIGSSGTPIGVNWNTIVQDSTGMHSTASNSSRITFAGSTGDYMVGTNVTFSSQASTFTGRVRIVVNDSSAAADQSIKAGGFTPRNGVGASALIRVASTTDYVTVDVWATATGSIEASSAQTVTTFWAYRVSP